MPEHFGSKVSWMLDNKTYTPRGEKYQIKNYTKGVMSIDIKYSDFYIWIVMTRFWVFQLQLMVYRRTYCTKLMWIKYNYLSFLELAIFYGLLLFKIGMSACLNNTLITDTQIALYNLINGILAVSHNSRKQIPLKSSDLS